MEKCISYIQAPITNKKPSAEVSLETIHTALTTNDSYKKATEEYRDILKDPESGERAVRVAKVNNFDYVTMSGTFTYVSNKNLKEHSGFICIDIDKLEDEETVHELKERLKNDKDVDTALIFISPSGNGIKWTVPIDINHDQPEKSHLKYFRALQNYVKNSYGIEIDESCKDVARACFLCYDGNSYMNKDALPIGEAFIETWGEPEVVFNSATNRVQTTNETPWEEYNESGDVEELLKNYGYTFVKSEGMGNKYLRPGSPTSEYSLIVFRDTGMVHVHSDSCHKLEVGTHTPARIFCDLEAGGDWKHAAKLLKQKGYEGTVDEKTLNIISGSSLPSEVPQFWEIAQVKKNGEKGYQCKIKDYQFHKFCFDALSIGLVEVPHNDKGHQLVQSHDKIIEKIRIEKVFRIVVKYLEEHIKPYNQEMFEVVYNAFYQYWHNQNLKKVESAMTVITPKLLEEVPDKAYVYYQNGFLEITSNGYEFKSYKGLETYVWHDQIIERDWLGRTSYIESNWANFIWKISGQDKDRFDHIRHSYGYLIHGFKDRANPKAVILVDEELKEDLSKASGGTGKSIAASAIDAMKHTCLIAGKTWDPSKTFAFSQVKPGHQIMWIDDAKSNLKFDFLYNAVTQDFEIEYKNKNRFSIPFEESPKVLISTNHPIRGDDASSVRRQHVVEVAPYFSKDHTAKDEYGERLVEDTDWDEKDWQKFDNFMIDCVVDYLKNGLTELEINYRYKRTIDQITPELFEWIEEHMELGKFYPTSDILHGKKPKADITGFRMLYPDIKKVSRYIGADLEVFCNFKGYYLKKERRDKRGYIICEEKPSDE